MSRLRRYLLALTISTLITAGVSWVTDSIILLVAIGQVYAVGSAIVLRPDVRHIAKEPSSTSGAVFTGVTVFGVVSMANGVTDSFHVGALVLAIGLAYFGFVSGIWLTIEID